MSLRDYELVLGQAQEMHVLQVALGGGNPNQHPDFETILRLTRAKYGIVPNYTTNGRGLTSAVLAASKEYCGAVAVSAYTPYHETADAIRLLLASGVQTNIHFILDSSTIGTAIEWLESPPAFMDGVNALVFLNYKPVGRSVQRERLLCHSGQLGRFFSIAAEGHHLFRIGFDACMASGICQYTTVPSMFCEGCDAGRFSMFVSEDLRMYPCSFMVEAGYDGIQITDRNMLATWQSSSLFSAIRSRQSSSRCIECPKGLGVLGECPIFPDIRLCLQYD